QAVSITSLNMAAFARAVSAAQEIYGKFDQQFADGTMMLWATSDVDQGQAECLDIANCYFTPKQSIHGLSSIAFQKEVDPHGVLVNMAVGDAVSVLRSGLVRFFDPKMATGCNGHPT
ncbi:hypothetical protein L208DRAFT_1304319, partial [Tricholoma matsutake]